MNKAKLSRMGGWALILIGLIFFLDILTRYVLPKGYLWNVAYLWIALVLAPLFMLIGLLGLWARYGKHVGWIGRNVLLAGALLTPLSYYLWYIQALYYGAIPALVLGQICLAIFGIAALKHKPLSRMNWLPLAAGVWFPVVYPLQYFVPTKVFVLFESVFYAPHVVDILIYTVACGQAAAMVLLGLILQGDATQQKI